MEPQEYLWAKSAPFMSVWKHSLCTGLCAEIFLRSKASGSLLHYLSAQLQVDEDDAVHVISYLASVHDIGKIHPSFQSKDSALYERLKEGMQESFQGSAVEAINRTFRHEYYSAEVLRRIWRSKGHSASTIAIYASVIAQHHQKPKNPAVHVLPKNPIWVHLQDELEQRLSALFLKESPFRVPQQVDACCMLIVSILILMDWVSSSALFDDAENMKEDAISELAHHVLELYQLISDNVFPSAATFSSLFPSIKKMRPLQLICSSLNADAPLTIIEAPMGEGKTEAALYLAARICQTGGRRGVYMALPSQATSNQIAARIDSMLSGLTYGTARLLHGTAFLVQNIPDRYSTEDEAYAAKWVRPARMGFLGANAVGTVDQAMAAVLRTRFSMLRLAGLSNKVLIIDEIHAYDQYMSQIIETLLRWCHGMQIPVILLSATLQMTQKQRYISCFGAHKSEPVGSAYPMVTQIMADAGVIETPLEASAHYHYRIQPVRMDDDPDSIAAAALRSVQGGGCLAVMVNTVAHAQAIYKALRAGDCQGTKLLLFHSRFPMSRRAEIEKQCVAWFGKDRTKRPERAILVATQVVEQSIDLDFDGMMSELAPVDLLLQRAGRLHRHRENSRPEGFQEPVMQVLLPPEDAPDDLEHRFGPSGYVYDPFLLSNTEKLLSEERIIRIPEDIRENVETVYATVTAENKDAWTKRMLRGLLETTKARGCTWPDPEPDTFFPMESDIYYDVPETEDGFDASSEASTRLGDNSLRVAFCEEGAFDRYREEGIPPQEETDIYLNSVSLRLNPSDLTGSDSAYSVTRGKLSGLWLLRGKAEVQVGNKLIHNNPELGVYWEVK